MDNSKALEIARRYGEEILTGPMRNTFQAKHMAGMVPKMEEFEDTEKLMRWLGFMQGALWANGLYTIEELAEHNRTNE